MFETLVGGRGLEGGERRSILMRSFDVTYGRLVAGVGRDGDEGGACDVADQTLICMGTNSARLTFDLMHVV